MSPADVNAYYAVIFFKTFEIITLKFYKKTNDSCLKF
jgi:hypothetical protein